MTDVELVHGVPLFLDQLLERLKSKVDPLPGMLGDTATLHGAELLQRGFTIGQVVHEYGNVCQAITQLATELGAVIPANEYRMLNLSLDVAIAEAVTEYARQRETAAHDRSTERIGFLAHELRNHLGAATLAYDAVRSGDVSVGGSTAALIGKSLDAMRDLVNRSLAEVRLEAGVMRKERILVGALLEDVEIAASLQARTRRIRIEIVAVEHGLAVEGDAQIVASIMSNLVQNACKYTHPDGNVVISTRVTADNVHIDVRDECGGLPRGKADELFQPYEQRAEDRSGLGLGLALSLRGADAIGGTLAVADLPGIGCVFSLGLRRSPTLAS